MSNNAQSMTATFWGMPYPIHPKAGIIKELRAQLGASNREIAKRAQVPYNLINKYLDGLMKPHRDDAFDSMEEALHEIERERRIEGTLPVSYGKGLPILLIDDTIDAIDYDEKKQTGVYVIAVTLLSLKPSGKAWGRKISARGLDGLLKPGDHVAVDSRKPEPGHVVEVMVDGKPTFGILVGSGKTLRLTFTSQDFEDVPISTKDLRGVVIAKVENRPNDVRVLFEYPHGMTLTDKS